jgi:hypothetical protein
VSYRDDLARAAVTEALRLRSRHGRASDQPICPIDLALDEGVDVRFVSIPSLEGLYTPEGRAIVLGSLRPHGRRAFTCAHELGHDAFGHGLRIDELLDGNAAPNRKDDPEYVADRFAAALLMPKLAVLQAFVVRGWQVGSCTAAQAFAIAGLLGVGYTTLIGYLAGTLRVIDQPTAERLRRIAPKTIRAEILGTDAPGGLVLVDEFWRGRPVDLEVGDLVIVPHGASASGGVLEPVRERLLAATAPGTARLERGPWKVAVRVMRLNYTGLAGYRHLEDVDDDAA